MGVLLATLSMILAGVGAIFLKLSVGTIGWLRTTLVYYVLGLIITLALSLVLQQTDVFSKNGIGWGVLAALALTASLFFYNSSLEYVNVSVTVTIYSLEVVVAVVLAFLFLGEKMLVHEWIGVGFAILAIGLLSWRKN
jgi:transporter family protein